jgi:predicted amidohydrolase YtcJ
MRSQLYFGGVVHALDGSPPAEALVVRDGRVLATGERASMETLATTSAQRIDLRGAFAIPGLIDTHPHLLHFGAFAYPLADLADARDHDDIVARLREKAGERTDGEWVMATPVGEPHYFLRRSYRDLKEGILPDRIVLDRATTRHPVLIQAWAPTTPNVCALNSRGLAELGLTRETPDRVGHVWIEKDARGEPTGRLTGSVNNYYGGDPYMEELLRRVPLLRLDAVVPGTLAAVKRYHRMGVTTIYEGHAMGAGEVGAYRALREQGLLRMRVLTALEAESYGLPWTHSLSEEEFRANLELALAQEETHDDLLRARGVTLSRGGPCGPGFLRMHSPYRGPYGEPTQGRTFVSEEKEQLALTFCAERGLRLNFIGAGDRDHDEFLARAEAVDRRISIRDRAWILQHAYLVTEEQARRYAALGFQVTTSLSFTFGKGDLFEERIGRHVWADLIPLRRLLDAGLVVGCGTDWGPKNVFEHLELAETHRFAGSGRRNDGPAQRVDRAAALAMWTRDAARVLGWEGIGTLAPGNHADLAIVDRDPLSCPTKALAETRVLRTVLGGEAVFDAGSL